MVAEIVTIPKMAREALANAKTYEGERLRGRNWLVCVKNHRARPGRIQQDIMYREL